MQCNPLWRQLKLVALFKPLTGILLLKVLSITFSFLTSGFWLTAMSYKKHRLRYEKLPHLVAMSNQREGKLCNIPVNGIPTCIYWTLPTAVTTLPPEHSDPRLSLQHILHRNHLPLMYRTLMCWVDNETQKFMVNTIYMFLCMYAHMSTGQGGRLYLPTSLQRRTMHA